MKTTFSRQLVFISALLFFAMLLSGIAYRMLLVSSIKAENEQNLMQQASSIADLAQAYDAAGLLEEGNWDFRMNLSFLSKISATDALLCDENGVVRFCSCENFSCGHVGRSIPESLQVKMLESGSFSEVTSLSSLYSQQRYAVGMPIVSGQSGSTIGFVVVSMGLTAMGNFLSRSTLLLAVTFLGSLLVALLAAALFSRSQVKPLRALADTAARFGRGELSARVELPKGAASEVVELGQAFNTMAESLQQSERRREEFIANVSHELKTPMTTIGGFVDGMLDGTIPPEKHEYYMRTVSAEVRRLSRLVRNMLDISRLQAQGIDESRKVRFDLTDSISDVLISFEQKITQKNLQVNVELPERGIYTRADRDGITQVLYNLVDNAVKFCPDGGSLSLSLSQQDGKAAVAVANTGPTIAPEELPLLFDRFHKTDKSRSVDREGWGLGLYIAKTIIDAHGGSISAASENGLTTFRFTLPSVR